MTEELSLEGAIIGDPMPSAAPVPVRGLSVRTIVAASIGYALEHFDLAIYGFMALTLAKVFFPSHDENLSLLVTFGTAGASYVMRPLGAILIGSYADRKGRKAALSLSLMLMGIGSAMVAIMPGYAQIGIWAPVGVLLARLLQGFSGGGEGGSSVTFLAEQHPERRGELTSWLLLSGGLTFVFASAAGAVLNALFTPAQILAWAWRLPFLFGALVYPAGVYIRRRTDETPEFRMAEPTSRPVRDTWTEHRWLVLAAICYGALGMILVYLTGYMVIYAQNQLHLPPSVAYVPGVVSGFTAAIVGPLFGRLSDRVGRFRLMLPAAIAVAVVSAPVFEWLVHRPTWTTLLAVQVLLTLLGAVYAGGSAGLSAELFPVRTRTTASSISVALSLTIFGGFAPFIFQALVAVTHDPAAPSLYLIFGAVLSTVALIVLRLNHRLR